MPLLNRISRLFTADAHAVLDRLEEPDVLLRQAIREMEEHTIASAERIRCLEQEQATLARTQADLSRSLTRLGSELDLCLAAGDDELARGVIRRRLAAERATHRVDAQNAQVAARLDDCLAKHQEFERELVALREQAEAAGSGAAAGVSANVHVDAAITASEIEVALLREKQRRAQS